MAYADLEGCPFVQRKYVSRTFLSKMFFKARQVAPDTPPELPGKYTVAAGVLMSLKNESAITDQTSFLCLQESALCGARISPSASGLRLMIVQSEIHIASISSFWGSRSPVRGPNLQAMV